MAITGKSSPKLSVIVVPIALPAKMAPRMGRWQGHNTSAETIAR
jgi:hypothetical protein